MSPRPRKASDDEIFLAAMRVMQRVPPAGLTLAAVGAEAGVSASALVQRFGSKLELMRALNAHFAGGTRDLMAEHRAASDSPLAALRTYARSFAPMVGAPKRLAHHLAYLQADIADPVMYKHVRAHTIETRDVLAEWVAEAVACGELRQGIDAQAVARLVQAVVTGSMMSYAFYREGKAADWLEADLGLALTPYLATGRAAPRPPT